MPKITFHNLPVQKKDKLLLAAQKEFSRVPLYDASISNIVKSAKIPRGSFYQYFEDKEDAYYFLLSSLVRELNQLFIDKLQKNQGDLFKAVIELFQTIIEKEEHYNLLKNAFLNMTYKVEDQFSGIFSQDKRSAEDLKTISPFININLLNIKHETDLIYIMQIIGAVTFRNFVERFAKDLTNEEAMTHLEMEMNLLRNGLGNVESKT